MFYILSGKTPTEIRFALDLPGLLPSAQIWQLSIARSSLKPKIPTDRVAKQLLYETAKPSHGG